MSTAEVIEEVGLHLDGARPSAPPAPPTRHALGARYWTLWAAGAVSSWGDGLALVAFPLLATRSTSNPTLIAGVAAAQRLPWLLALLTGALADRIELRRFVATVEASRCFCLLAFGLAIAVGGHDLLALYLAALALGLFETAFSAASMTAIPTVVIIDDLPRANGYLYAAQMAGEQFLGPAIGGALFAASAASPFAIDGTTFAASAVLLAIALPGRPRHARREVLPSAGTTVLDSCRVGWQWFRRHREASQLATCVAALAFCQAMVLSLLVLLCTQDLALSPAGYGLFLGVAAIGNVAGGVLAARVVGDRSCTSVLRTAGFVAASCYVILAIAPNATIAAFALAIEAVVVAVANVASVTLRQTMIPADLLGRVSNIFRMCIFGAMPIGAVAAGVIATMTSVRTAIVVAGVAQVAATALWLRRPAAR